MTADQNASHGGHVVTGTVASVAAASPAAASPAAASPVAAGPAAASPAAARTGRRAPAGDAGAGLSIVVPVYNEAAGLAQLHAAISAAAARLRKERGLACEIVYVDDGSRDASLEVAATLPAGAAAVQVVSLSRNFGKEAALLAGLDHARRGAVLFMDADGQHPPQLIEQLIGHWLDDGYDVVYTA
ncbi:MAG: glycosyltransferase, partial [Bradyrhizobiaceae bacterium]|nr:glycosyltransferase [Bradyrhizobiaceae bacterium]